MPGTMKPVKQKANPGLAKLPTDVRNKMGYMQKGGKVTKKYAKGGMNSEDEFVFDEDMLAEQAKKPTYAGGWLTREMTKLDERNKMEDAIQERVREKAKAEPKTFGEAFKKARAAGEKVFEHPKGSGKMFTTETAEEKAKRLAANKKKPEAKKESAKAPAKKEPTKAVKEVTKNITSKRLVDKEVAKKGTKELEGWRKVLKDKEEKEKGKGKKKTVSSRVLSVSDIIGAAKGGMMKYNKGGMANCGASMKPSGGSRNK